MPTTASLLGYDNNLDPAFLNVKNRVRHVTLGENDLILAKFNNGFPLAYSGEKFLGVKSLIDVVMACPAWSPQWTLSYRFFRQEGSEKARPTQSGQPVLVSEIDRSFSLTKQDRICENDKSL
jgi:hypothetical protein